MKAWNRLRVSFVAPLMPPTAIQIGERTTYKALLSYKTTGVLLTRRSFIPITCTGHFNMSSSNPKGAKKGRPKHIQKCGYKATHRIANLHYWVEANTTSTTYTTPINIFLSYYISSHLSFDCFHCFPFNLTKYLI